MLTIIDWLFSWAESPPDKLSALMTIAVDKAVRVAWLRVMVPLDNMIKQ